MQHFSPDVFVIKRVYSGIFFLGLIPRSLSAAPICRRLRLFGREDRLGPPHTGFGGSRRSTPPLEIPRCLRRRSFFFLAPVSESSIRFQKRSGLSPNAHSIYQNVGARRSPAFLNAPRFAAVSLPNNFSENFL